MVKLLFHSTEVCLIHTFICVPGFQVNYVISPKNGSSSAQDNWTSDLNIYFKSATTVLHSFLKMSIVFVKHQSDGQCLSHKSKWGILMCELRYHSFLSFVFKEYKILFLWNLHELCWHDEVFHK